MVQKMKYSSGILLTNFATLWFIILLFIAFSHYNFNFVGKF